MYQASGNILVRPAQSSNIHLTFHFYCWEPRDLCYVPPHTQCRPAPDPPGREHCKVQMCDSHYCKYVFGLATLQLSPLTGSEELHILKKTQYEEIKYRMQNQYPVCVSNTHASNRDALEQRERAVCKRCR